MYLAEKSNKSKINGNKPNKKLAPLMKHYIKFSSSKIIKYLTKELQDQKHTGN
jgi:hypothetical protein